MVSCRHDALWDISEDPSAIVSNGAEFSVFYFARMPELPKRADGNSLAGIRRGTTIKLTREQPMVIGGSYPISPPYTSTRHSKPMHTPNTGTFPAKYRIASRDMPESVLG